MAICTNLCQVFCYCGIVYQVRGFITGNASGPPMEHTSAVRSSLHCPCCQQDNVFAYPTFEYTVKLRVQREEGEEGEYQIPWPCHRRPS